MNIQIRLQRSILLKKQKQKAKTTQQKQQKTMLPQC